MSAPIFTQFEISAEKVESLIQLVVDSPVSSEDEYRFELIGVGILQEVISSRILRHVDLVRGVQILADRYPHFVIAILQDDDDEFVADGLVQAAMFGELRFIR